MAKMNQAMHGDMGSNRRSIPCALREESRSSARDMPPTGADACHVSAPMHSISVSKNCWHRAGISCAMVIAPAPLWKKREGTRIRGLPTGARHPPSPRSTASARDHSEQVLGINRNWCSGSVGIAKLFVVMAAVLDLAWPAGQVSGASMDRPAL